MAYFSTKSIATIGEHSLIKTHIFVDSNDVQVDSSVARRWQFRCF